MKIITQDITTITDGIICHQVNCKGVMGAGLALQIRRKFPSAYGCYMEAYRANRLLLGNVIYCNINDKLTVAHICGQDRYGRDRKYTDYDALKKALKDLNLRKFHSMREVYIPYNMGCTLGGGDWNMVFSLIETNIPAATIVVRPQLMHK